MHINGASKNGIYLLKTRMAQTNRKYSVNGQWTGVRNAINAILLPRCQKQVNKERYVLYQYGEHECSSYEHESRQRIAQTTDTFAMAHTRVQYSICIHFVVQFVR